MRLQDSVQAVFCNLALVRLAHVCAFKTFSIRDVDADTESYA